jgi:hypothetical protein
MAATLSHLSAIGRGGRKKLERALGGAKHPSDRRAMPSPHFSRAIGGSSRSAARSAFCSVSQLCSCRS